LSSVMSSRVDGGSTLRPPAWPSSIYVSAQVHRKKAITAAGGRLELLQDVVERHWHHNVRWRLAAPNGMGKPCHIAGIGFKLASGGLAPPRRGYKCWRTPVEAGQRQAEVVAIAVTDTRLLDHAFRDSRNRIQAGTSPW